jgi:ATP-dependent Clp protease ATP-binding subunit ClpA
MQVPHQKEKPMSIAEFKSQVLGAATDVTSSVAHDDRPLLIPPALFPSQDLTFLAHCGELILATGLTNGGAPATGGRLPLLIDSMARALYRRRNRHVLVTGKRGVGKTTLVWEFARRAAVGEIPFLKENRFLWIDVQDVSPDESRPRFMALLEFLDEYPDLIVCLDGLGSLLRVAGGATNKALLRAALRHPQRRIIGVMSQWDFDELLASDAEILDVCTRVEVPEPDEATALEIVRQAAQRLETDFNCRIPGGVLERSVALAGRFIWNQRYPTKAIRVLERVCEDLDYERTQRAGQNTEVTTDHVIRVVSDISRVPVETLTGDIDDTDYERILGSAVVGQDQAVAAVASELRLIKAGITDPGKPASVMLFCGLNGVGKTELAKRLAEIYSTSKRLQIYTMGNFVESHSVSGIIGVPAGYVGHDQGGQLINDLNADPYGVFLMDEIEKSHPDVMKPFLNLFDEGWIVDQKGVKAYADRAIFILTSNAGYEAISQMHQDKRPMEDIVEHVKNALARVRNERSGQPVLSQAFLARIKRIQIFNPLNEPAMLGITQILLQRIQEKWLKHRGKTIVVSDELVQHIARQGYAINTKSGGREGGRGIRRLLAELVEDRIQLAAIKSKHDYARCHTLRLGLNGTSPEIPASSNPSPQVVVSFVS